MTERFSTRRGRWARRLPRVAAALVASGVVAAGVTACQAQPGAAGFLAGHRYTQAQVDDLFEAYRDDVHGQVRDAATVRQAIARDLVMRDLLRRVAAERRITLPEPDYAKVAEQSQVPASDPFLRLDVATEAYLDTVQNKLGVTARPTDADYRDIYRSLVAGGLDKRQLPYSQAKPQIAKIVDPKAVGLRRVLQRAADRYHARLNPRYGDPAYPISSGVRSGPIQGELHVRFGDPTPDVVVTPTSADPLSRG